MVVTHKAQLVILKQLLICPKARFSDLNKTSLTSDQFTFHLKKLIQNGLVEKAWDGYHLTTKGLEQAGRIDIKSVKMVKQPKLSVMICAVRGEEEKTEVLLSERLTDPIIGKVSFPVTKVILGEPLMGAAKRCLREETGLESSREEFAGVVQYRHYKNEIPQEVAVIICFQTRKFSGTLRTKTRKGVNKWMELRQAKELPNRYPHFTQLLSLLGRSKPFFREFEVRE